MASIKEFEDYKNNGYFVRDVYGSTEEQQRKSKLHSLTRNELASLKNSRASVFAGSIQTYQDQTQFLDQQTRINHLEPTLEKK